MRSVKAWLWFVLHACGLWIRAFAASKTRLLIFFAFTGFLFMCLRSLKSWLLYNMRVVSNKCFRSLKHLWALLLSCVLYYLLATSDNYSHVCILLGVFNMCLRSLKDNYNYCCFLAVSNTCSWSFKLDWSVSHTLDVWEIWMMYSLTYTCNFIVLH